MRILLHTKFDEHISSRSFTDLLILISKRFVNAQKIFLFRPHLHNYSSVHTKSENHSTSSF